MMSSGLNTFFRSWAHYTAIQTTTLIVLAGTFAVFATVLGLLHQTEHIFKRWGENISVTVFLNKDADEASRSAISQYLDQVSGFKSQRYVSSAEALADFRTQVQDYAKDLVEDATFGNPLPASFEVTLDSNVWKSKASLKELTETIRAQNGVEQVSYGQLWVETYSKWFAHFTQLSWLLISVLTLGSLLIVGNSIRSSIVQRQNEIEVLELVGATRWTIRFPFIIEGALNGLLASLLALTAANLLWQAAFQSLFSAPELWGFKNFAVYLPIEVQILTLAIGPITGGLGAYLCLRGLNDGWLSSRGLT